MTILDTVGTMEVREKAQIKIPVYTEKTYNAYNTNYLGLFEKERITIPEITIVKHSKDITDLIEVGDVIEVHFPVRNIIRKIYVDEYFEDSMILNGIISGNVILRTILTHEQYERDCYTVKEEEC